MKIAFPITGAATIALMFAFSACSTQEEKPKAAPPPAPAAAPAAKAPAASAKAPAPEKAKVEKASGDVGLLDTEKNYMILVTKQGKLITLDFDDKTKVTKLTPTPGKVADIGLGSSATVTYSGANGKNVATGVEYKVKKGGD